MQHVPDDARQAEVYPLSLNEVPGCHSLSDDDLYAWCTHLLYRPGEFSLSPLSLVDGIWSSHCDENGYAQPCPSLRLKQHHQPHK
ncbi:MULTISPECIES: hypothetical protein [Lelliottia]|uniref:Antirestriction protein n=1 Tax=Lelliottia aquatilis TaxID=2080838 RepID=A0ABX5A0E1_9ENTR|nr:MULTISPECIES: hypothetical protein [Lelliottia]POZ15907.1 hypothetical protein C3Z09_13595 [Lelliottia aquatilis]POZ19145.1 hypothetical protein C3708_16370 [Lelliottia sp. 7254-16]POZ22009.1 hypothetical protein C3712_14395 [Lelliottia aquatilis]POZ24623.1 hypothetical protein C3711_15140 [Lelliottia aquatilis]POZ31795.1 hypothetical protein C3710_15165 [Lelliottia aquatilis]